METLLSKKSERVFDMMTNLIMKGYTEEEARLTVRKKFPYDVIETYNEEIDRLILA